MIERIPLRAFYVKDADPPMHGIALPDGRLIVDGIALPDGRLIVGGHTTYSSERTLYKYNPGTEIVWVPSVDETINRVEEEDE